ncbi:MAG: hypothetical protein J0I21_21645 [Alphaproteobacteria bacterium]|nr:hypothetical protein [Alphaproteobacteria bacterium]
MVRRPPVLTMLHAGVRERVVGVGGTLLVNVLLPFLIFALTRSRLGDVHALIASSAPPLVWSVVELTRQRRVDALSLLVLTGIALSLLAFIGGGGVHFLQLRERLVTGLIGLIFLGSVAINRPLIYYLARASITRASPEKAGHFVAIRDTPIFRRTMLTMTLAWGVGLVVECAVAVTLTEVLTVSEFMLVGYVIGYGSTGLLTLWSYWYARRRIAVSMRASIEAASALPARDRRSE